MGNLGIECSNLCKNKEDELEHYNNFSPNTQNNTLKSKKYFSTEKNQKNLTKFSENNYLTLVKKYQKMNLTQMFQKILKHI